MATFDLGINGLQNSVNAGNGRIGDIDRTLNRHNELGVLMANIDPKHPLYKQYGQERAKVDQNALWAERARLENQATDSRNKIANAQTFQNSLKPVDNSSVVRDATNILGVQKNQASQTPTATINNSPDYFRQQSEQLRAGGDIEGANSMTMIANQLDTSSKYEKEATNAYNQLGQMLDSSNSKYMDFMNNVDQDFKNKLLGQKDLFDKRFGPGGELEQKQKSLYEGLNQLTGKRQAEEQALAQSLATKSGDTPAQLGSAIGNIASRQLEDSMKIQQDQISELDKLYKTYDQLLGNFIAQYGGSTDKNVVNTYKEIKAQADGLKSSWLEGIRNIQAAQMQRDMTPSSSGGTTTTQDPMNNIKELLSTDTQQPTAQGQQSPSVLASAGTSGAVVQTPWGSGQLVESGPDVEVVQFPNGQKVGKYKTDGQRYGINGSGQLVTVNA